MRKAAAAVLAAILAISIGISVRAAELDISVKSAILVDCDSGKTLYEENPDEELAPASVTKIMTMLLIMEAIDRGEITYDTVVTASERAKSMGGSTIFLDTGEQMSVDDLLKGIAVASGNDACVAMAEHLSGSVEAFVDVMNNRARELGMTHTHFVTCNGLDADGHYSSARDIAQMSLELLKHEDILKYTGIWMDSLRDGKFQLANTNKLIRYYDGATGLKTGSTSKAGNCISATAERNGTRLCAVVLGSPNSKARFAAASTLLNYGFDNYAAVGMNEGDAAGIVTIKKGAAENATCVLEAPCRATVAKSSANSVEKEIDLPREIQAPIKKGEKLGVMKLVLDGEVIAEANIVAGEDVKRVSFAKMYAKVIKKWSGAA